MAGRVKREWLFIASLLGVFLFTFVATLSHYGPTWDIWELYLGDKTLRFYTTLDVNQLDYSRADLEVYRRPDHPAFETAGQSVILAPTFWPVGFVSAAATKYLFFTKFHLLDAIDAHHVVLGLWVAVLYGAVYLFVLRVYGFLPAVIAVVALATHPQMVAQSHFNLKDVPQTTMFTLVLFAVRQAIEHQRARWLLAAAALWGVALATKANAVFIPFILALYLVYDLFLRWRCRRAMPARGWWIALGCSPFLALIVMLMLWPYLLLRFPDNLWGHIEFVASRGLEGTSGWSLRPLLLAITTTPLPFLILLLVGLVFLGIKAWRRQLTSFEFLLIIWLVIPILRVSIPRAQDFDGIRHWMEFLPAAAILAGLGGASLLRWAVRRFVPRAVPPIAVEPVAATGADVDRALSSPAAAILVLLVLAWFSPTIHWNIHAHPNQIVFFNSLVGGPGGAQRRGWPDATDYWGSSYRAGMEMLNARAEPGSFVVTGVAQQIVILTAKNWLRPDLTTVYHSRAPLLFGHNRVPVYFMSITRPDFYPAYWLSLEQKCQLWRQIEVDGAVILKIYRLPPSPPPIGPYGQPTPPP